MIQSTIIRAYQEEKDRSKQPGYVCTYDDYDSDFDETTSYGGVVSEMARGNLRTHGSHTAPRGTHLRGPADEKSSRAEHGAGGFGAGIM